MNLHENFLGVVDLHIVHWLKTFFEELCGYCCWCSEKMKREKRKKTVKTLKKTMMMMKDRYWMVTEIALKTYM